MRRTLFPLLLAGFFATAGLAAQPSKPGPVKNRIAIQVNEDDSRKWNAILGNVNNIQGELKAEGVAITVVAIGPGLGMLTADSLVANRVEEAQAAGIRFVACGNSMQAQHVEKDDLAKGVAVTKAGYVELMRLQQQGWTYLRP